MDDWSRNCAGKIEFGGKGVIFEKPRKEKSGIGGKCVEFAGSGKEN